MLYLMSLNHSPDQCPGVVNEIRDRVVLMNSTMTEVLQTHGCTLQGGWVSKSAHQFFMLIDAPNAHAVDDATVDLGMAVWSTLTMYPLITLQEAVEGLPK